jgi:hypothetical protein
MKLSSSKWILFSLIISSFFVNLICTQPTTTALEKRQTAQESNGINDLHHQPTALSRTVTSTATAKATATNKGGQNGGSGSSSDNNGSNNESSIIPAYTTEWFGKYLLDLYILLRKKSVLMLFLYINNSCSIRDRIWNFTHNGKFRRYFDCSRLIFVFYGVQKI